MDTSKFAAKVYHDEVDELFQSAEESIGLFGGIFCGPT
jgi:hypothetical protein